MAKESKSVVTTRLEIAEGAIDPAPRIANGDISEPKVEAMMQRLLTDEFDESVAGVAIPCKCVDGRSRADSLVELGGNAAGGTFSLVMADALTNNRYRRAGEPSAVHAAQLYRELGTMGYAIGVHDDDKALAPNCGCGAEDKLDAVDPDMPSILGYMTRRAADIQRLLGSIGVEVSDALNTQLVSKAMALRSEHYASTGSELRQAAIDAAGNESVVETLTGTHNEVVLRINTNPTMRLNRHKLKAAFGDAYQTFNLDIADLQFGTKVISLTDEEAYEKFVSALYYNVATACVLAGPGLRLIVK